MKFAKIFLVLSLLSCKTSIAQNGSWVTSSGRYVARDVTPEAGKKNALDIARSEAIKKVVGIKVSEELFRSKTETTKGELSIEYFDTFSKLSRSTSAGKILKEEIQYSTTIEDNFPVYNVSLRALVVEEKGETDPSFQVEINLQNPVVFARGDPSKNDELRFKIKSTQDCYIYLFNILSNDSVQLILPNKYLQNNAYKTDKTEQEYEREIKTLGMYFKVELPRGLLFTKEALYVIALKDKIEFTSEHLVRDGSNIIPTYKAALLDIMNWLIKIPPDKRTEAFSSYEIRRAKEN